MKELLKQNKIKNKEFLNNKNINGKNGITLIALVITIVVLLILASVSIAMLTGDNGILTKAREAKEQTEISTEKEQIKLAFGAVKQEKLINKDTSNITAEELEKELKKLETNVEIIEEMENLIVTYKKSNRKYTITQKGEFIDNASQPSEDIIIKVREETVKIMKESNGNIEAKTMIVGTEAYIKFEVDTEEGTNLKIEPSIPYKITQNGSYEFTITGTKSNGKSKTIKYIVNVNNYVESPEAWIDFNGTSYIECKDINQNDLAKEFTIATKVKVNKTEQTSKQYMGIWGRHISSTTGIALQFQENDTMISGTDYTPYYDKWVDIVRTFEAKDGNTGELKLYINGEVKNNKDVTIIPCEKFYIGNSIDFEKYDRRMNGEMSCIKIWNKALTEEEINSLDLFKDDVDIRKDNLYKNIMLKSQEEVDKIGSFVGTGHEFKKTEK